MKKLLKLILVMTLTLATLAAVSVTASAASAKALSSFTPISTDRYTGNQGDSFIDKLGTRNGYTATNGKTYSSGLEVWLARWNYKNEESWARATYNINGKYDTLTGRIVILSGSYNKNNFDITVEIRGDGKKLKSYKIVPTTSSKYVKVDISDVKKLEIYTYDNKAVSGGTSLGLVNFNMSKNETEDTLVTNVKKATMNKGTYLDLECGLLGDETVSWTSSKTSVATISKDGTVFAKKKGTVTISAKTDMGRTAKVKITIE